MVFEAFRFLSVLVFHLFTWPVGGFLGVDLFFVLSGFLISNRLLRDSARFGARHLRDFYFGRVLRIVPALAEMILLYGAIRLGYPDQVTLFVEMCCQRCSWYRTGPGLPGTYVEPFD